MYFDPTLRFPRAGVESGCDRRVTYREALIWSVWILYHLFGKGGFTIHFLHNFGDRMPCSLPLIWVLNDLQCKSMMLDRCS
jgi:hypothetical protein